VLELANVSKFYGGNPAVKDVSLTIAEGEFVTLLGPSGSGKSTILGMVAGLLAPDGGTIILDGRDVRRVSAADRGVGVVFQHYALFPHMTVAENIAYGLKRRRWAKRRIKERVEEMLALIGLPGHGARRPSQLSGGQQQRVALARALAYEPAVLLMDEPLGALDREIRLQMQEEIRRIHRELRPSVLYVTHDRDEAFALSDRVGVMRNAALVALETCETLFEKPQSAFIAHFFGDRQLLEVEVLRRADGTATIAVGGAEGQVSVSELLADGEPCRLAIARDSVAVAAAPNGTGLVIPATLRDVIYRGHSSAVHCTTTVGGHRMVAETSSEHASTLDVGSDVYLNVKLADAMLVPVE
jgi:putative spermidine/putrescine transport system ATP-binding protein